MTKRDVDRITREVLTDPVFRKRLRALAEQFAKEVSRVVARGLVGR